MSAIKISIEHEGRKAEIEIPLELIKEMARKQDKNEAISRTKQLPKIGEENRSSFPVIEAAKIKPKISGIKEKNGVEVYQCYYWCKNESCRHKGKRYIQPDRDFVTCHECGTKLKVRPATEFTQETGEHAGLPFQDSFGNFYRADEIYEESEQVANEWVQRTAQKDRTCPGCKGEIKVGGHYFQLGKGKIRCPDCYKTA